ncbi:hypothetical protein MMC30_007320 [Trapelia coarctata]|nr:hypothetical protein [Trapelia coarctata]
MRYGHSLNRGTLIIELDIADPNWEISEDLGTPIESGLDLEVEYLLGGLRSWDRMDIVLSQRTRKNRYWRSSTTRMLERKLGPNLSKEKRRLTFRPYYFYHLNQMRNTDWTDSGSDWACEFIRSRKHLSNPARDLVDAEMGIDAASEEEDDYFIEVPDLSDDEGVGDDSADNEEEDGDETDVDSDTISMRAEKAIAAVQELRLLEQREEIQSQPPSPEPTDPDSPTRQESHDDEDGYDDGGIDPVDLNFGLNI